MPIVKIWQNAHALLLGKLLVAAWLLSASKPDAAPAQQKGPAGASARCWWTRA